MKVGVVRFPGSCDEVDALLAAERVGDAGLLWHGDRDLQDVDAVVIPGGFSYGDYLRAGAIARFSPVMESVDVGLRFVCRQVECEVVNAATPFTRACAEGERLSIPVKHTTGRYHPPAGLDPAQVVLRYAPGHNPNGSEQDIAGVVNPAGNVFGLMPHPEHASDPLSGSTDGLKVFASMREHVETAALVA
ncbi:MAG: phosphoribosylformylglycinamidine synthase subunit PurQ [Actinobacteria bacterium]|nr:MAG: phosphoribosylformylglycinamidine synthase subunit PurQ [Actinomycetota bacterium]